MQATLESATAILRALAETHLMDEMRHLHSGGSIPAAGVIEFLLAAGEAEYHDLLDPVSRQVYNRQIRLKPKD